jgi:hypothetical protein
MGLSPRDVDEMSLWQFRQCLEGWNEANGGEQAKGLDDQIFDELAAMLDAADAAASR